jgi:hypothetical protein
MSMFRQPYRLFEHQYVIFAWRVEILWPWQHRIVTVSTRQFVAQHQLIKGVITAGEKSNLISYGLLPFVIE